MINILANDFHKTEKFTWKCKLSAFDIALGIFEHYGTELNQSKKIKGPTHEYAVKQMMK